ncbi:TetR/AcrR family transcriptional regulator [Tersicoccus solisilvae]|uniref:TetR/AcrR family transcriptional regulator n=1 Tax=Tersicoccus solisilvae TaxID=1882339 RepID=UPI00166723DE|nr:TetR family transcriptional regulator C-terminal domain-containing protein [Tersicoccus solisilvae]
MDLTRRQSELADAALRIIARDGMAALSFRAVAAEAACSLGSVQKAFASKDLMLAAGFARLRQEAAPLPPGEPGRPTLRAWLVALLLGILPLDARRRATQRQGDAFAQQALTDPAIAAAIADSDAEVRGLLASLVTRARAEGEVPAHVDPVTTAWAVLALAQGLAMQLLYRPEPEADVRVRLDATVAALLR